MHLHTHLEGCPGRNERVLGLFSVALTLWGAGFLKDCTKSFCGIASLE